jgi:hypothetical protein
MLLESSSPRSTLPPYGVPAEGIPEGSTSSSRLRTYSPMQHEASSFDLRSDQSELLQSNEQIKGRTTSQPEETHILPENLFDVPMSPFFAGMGDYYSSSHVEASSGQSPTSAAQDQLMHDDTGFFELWSSSQNSM